MPTTFAKEDVTQCFGANCNQAPAYRVITLTTEGVVEGEQVGGIGVSLLCKECLISEQDFSNLGETILHGENSIPGPPDVGILILPMRLTKSQVAQLREEITEEVPTDKAI